MIINGKNTNSYKKSSSKGLEYYQNLKQSPQTIQQKMDTLWEEEKQPVSNSQPNKPTTVSTSDVLNLGKGPLSNQGLNNLISTRQVLLNKDNGTLTNNTKYTNNSTKLMPIQQMEDNIERFNTDKEYKQNTVNRIKEKNAKVAEEGSFGNVAKKTLLTPVALVAEGITGVLKGGEGYVDMGVVGLQDINARSKNSEMDRTKRLVDETYNLYIKGKNLTEEEKQAIYKEIENKFSQYKTEKEQEINYDKAFAEEFIKEDFVGNKIGKPVRQFTKEQTYLPEKVADIVQTVGNMVPSIYLGSKVGGAAGALGAAAQMPAKAGKVVQSVANMVPFVAQATGSAMEQALNAGAEYDDAYKYAKISGTIEGAIEMLSGGIGGLAGNKIISSKLGKEATKRITNKLIGKYALKLADAGIDMAGEGFEEVLSAYADPFIKRLTYDEQAQMATSEELTERFWDAVFASMLLKGGQAGAISLSQNTDANNQKIKEQVQQQIQNEVEIYKNNSEYAKYVPTNQNVDNNIKISNTSLDNVVNTQNLLNGINKNIEKGQTIDIKNKTTDEIKSEYEKLVPTQKNKASQSPQNALSNVDNQIIPNENKIAQNGNMKQTTQSDKVMDALLGKKTENVKKPVQIKAEETLNSAKQAGMTDIDINKATELNNLLQSNAKLQFYDENNLPQGFSEEDMKKVKVANGLYSNGTIYINKNSKNVVEKILGHELTHHLENTGSFNDLSNTILDSDVFYEYITEKGFQNVQAFKQNLLDNGYTEQQLDNEIVARFVEDNLFSNQDRINRIARKNTTLAEKIKNFISDLKVKLKGTAQEKQLMKIENMYRKALEQARSTENTASDVKYHISSNLSNDIDNVLVNLNERNPVKLREYTPNILVQNGIKDLPMYENPSHIRKNILTENEARNIGLQVAKNDHYHGLGKELYIKVIDSLDNPRAVLKYKNKSNEYIILTVVKDSQGNNIIVPVEVETDTYVNNVKIDINRIKSVYGYDRTNPDLNKYIKDSIKNNNLEKIYEKKKPSTGKTPQSVSNNSINQNDSSVNTEYSLNNKNDTAGKGPAFSLPETDNQGRKLTAEQQEFFKDSKVRDEEGRLLEVYHGTDSEEFTVFDKELSDEDNVLGQGLYFTADKEQGKKYGDRIYTTYLNIKNPFIIKDLTTYSLANEIVNQNPDADIIDSDYGVASTAKMTEYLIENGYDGIKAGENVYVAFESNQIKNVDNTNPTENPDIRYSVNPVELDEQMSKKTDKYGAIKKGENATRDIELPKQISNNKYVSQFARTMAEAGITPNEQVDQVKQMVLDGTLTHERITDKSALKYADKIINEDGFKGAVDMWNSAMKSGLTMDKNMIALGQQIYNQAVQNKDVTLVKQMIADLTYVSTVAGQNVQASRMFKKLTPDGKLYSLEKSLKKINEELLGKYEDKFKEIEIPENMAKKLLEAEDTTSADKVVEEIEEYIAKNIPSSLMDKLNAWRYLAMLGNPKTHIRNIIGNAAFVPVVEWKNVIGTGLEKLVPQNQRTKAIIKPWNEADKKLLDFAEYDFDTNKKHIKGEDKFNISTDINNKRRIFDNNILESARKFNSNMLEFEDELFFKRAYKSSLAQAMKARGITVDYARENSAESNTTMNELRDYAILEAQKATYRDFNTIANILSNAQRKAKAGYNNAKDIKGKVGYKAGELALEGLVPFKKTPTNILSRGVSYSSLGLMRGIGNAVLNVKKGNVTATQAIDQISQGLSGTSILALGILLAKYGILSGADKEDEKEAKFDKLKGSQNYALNIGDTSYTIDWLAPTSMPMFVGVELYKSLSGESDDDILTTMAKISEPAFEMSMLQGISSIMNTTKYSKTNPIASIAGNLGLNYINQYNPTLLGQVARTLEDTSRTTYVDKNSSQPAWLQKMIQKNVAKIPGANKSLVPVIDQWGRTKTEESILSRAVQNFISPGYVSKKNITEADKEIERLYKQVGEKDILPSYAPKYWNIDGERVDLTAKQYEKFAVEKGQDALNLIEELIKSDAYKKLDDKGKYNAIKYIYDYANQTNKVEITPEYPMDDWIKDAQELEKQGIDVETFIGLKVAVKDIKGDKDSKGNTKPYSASNKKKDVIDELIPGYSKKQKNLIYDALGISTKK